MISAVLALLLLMLPFTEIPAQAAVFSPALANSPDKAERQNTATIQFNPGEQEVILPIALKYEGLLSLSLSAAPGTTAYGYLKCGLYKDAACEGPYGASLHVMEGIHAKRSLYAEAGTVYLRCVLTRGENAGRCWFYMKASLIPGSDRTLAAGKTVLTGFDAAHTVCRYKVSVSKTSTLTLRVQGTDGRRVNAYFSLLNAKKEVLSAESHVICDLDESGAHYAQKKYVVSKGVYYIDLDMKGAYAEGYEVSYTTKRASDQSGTSKKKAVSLTVSGKAKTGLLTASEKKGSTDWYKVTLQKKTRIKVQVDAMGDGDVLLQVTDSTGADAWYGSRMIAPGETVFDAGKLPKGVYYIKMVKPVDQGSIAYSIRIQ